MDLELIKNLLLVLEMQELLVQTGILVMNGRVMSQEYICILYVRYTSRCKPGDACVGNPVTNDLNMVELLLQWNIDDPVSDFERTRNNTIFNTQGNRNPFIDNAYLATLIWGGAEAENVWIELGIDDTKEEIKFSIYPNPSINGIVNIKFNSINSVSKIEVYDLSGKVVKTFDKIYIVNNHFNN